jgi:RNA polymerase sigma-70 factor, ECF subfamily
VKDDAEAEDVLQEAYVRAYVHLGTFEGRARLSTWLTKIVIHEAGARLRRERRYTSLDDEGEEGALGHDAASERPEDLAASRELAAIVEAAIDRLPEVFRTVLMMRAVEGLSGVETAECLGVPEDTVKTRLFRARAQLQKDLERQANGSFHEVHKFLAQRCDRVVAGVLERIRALPSRPA